MKKKRRYFTREFKIETVRLITEEGHRKSRETPGLFECKRFVEIEVVPY